MPSSSSSPFSSVVIVDPRFFALGSVCISSSELLSSLTGCLLPLRHLQKLGDFYYVILYDWLSINVFVDFFMVSHEICEIAYLILRQIQSVALCFLSSVPRSVCGFSAPHRSENFLIKLQASRSRSIFREYRPNTCGFCAGTLASERCFRMRCKASNIGERTNTGTGCPLFPRICERELALLLSTSLSDSRSIPWYELKSSMKTRSISLARRRLNTFRDVRVTYESFR